MPFELQVYEAAKALHEHLAALVVMVRDGRLNEWNSGATVGVLNEARSVIENYAEEQGMDRDEWLRRGQ